jgi:hypothetical protein
MADDFKAKIAGGKSKLPDEVIKDSSVAKALGDLESAFKKGADDFAGKAEKLLSALKKSKKNVSKDKKAQKAVEEFETAVKTDLQKRMTFKDKSTKPS